MRFVILLVSVFFLALVFASPRRKRDACGEVSGPKGKWVPNGKTATLWCELCLDLVEIAKMYEECEEEEIRRELDKDCAKKFANDTLGEKACEATADEIMRDVINDTEHVNSTASCDRILNVKDCHYNVAFTYKLY